MTGVQTCALPIDRKTAYRFSSVTGVQTCALPILIQIARDGKISDDEIRDFAFISNKLDEISLAIDSLNLWVDKTAGEQGLNIELFREEKEKQK